MNTNSKILYNGPLKELYNELKSNNIVEVRGHKTIELLNKTISFDGKETGIINIKDIFKTSESYIDKETKWYYSQNPNNEYIKQYAQIWSTASDENGMTNSNYGFLMFSPQNGYQFKNVVKELKENPNSRRAIAYYTNPFMHYVGGNDHVCTVYVAYLIRNNKLNAFVSMRSNDIRFGLIGADLEWQRHMLQKIADELNIEVGNLNWHAVSLHLYERHFEQLLKIYEGE
jgi:thymidylate synthase